MWCRGGRRVGGERGFVGRSTQSSFVFFVFKDKRIGEEIIAELKERRVTNVTFYDIVFDFAMMDAFSDLEVCQREGSLSLSQHLTQCSLQNPPKSVTSVLSKQWLPSSIKEKGIATAVWTVIKTRSRRARTDGFMQQFVRGGGLVLLFVLRVSPSF